VAGLYVGADGRGFGQKRQDKRVRRCRPTSIPWYTSQMDGPVLGRRKLPVFSPPGPIWQDLTGNFGHFHLKAGDRSSSQVTHGWGGLDHNRKTRVDPHKTTRFFDPDHLQIRPSVVPACSPREVDPDLSAGIARFVCFLRSVQCPRRGRYLDVELSAGGQLTPIGGGSSTSGVPPTYQIYCRENRRGHRNARRALIRRFEKRFFSRIVQKNDA